MAAKARREILGIIGTPQVGTVTIISAGLAQSSNRQRPAGMLGLRKTLFISIS